MNNKINIQEIVDALAERNGITKKDADTFVRSMFDLIEDALEKDRYIKVKGLGTFKLIEVDERESVNVNTGERFLIEGHSKISFIPDNSLKEVINKPFAHFETVIVNNGVDLNYIENIPDNKETKIDIEESYSTPENNENKEIQTNSDINVKQEQDASILLKNPIEEPSTPKIEEIKKEENTSNNESEKKVSLVTEPLITKEEITSYKPEESNKEELATVSTENELSSVERKKEIFKAMKEEEKVSHTALYIIISITVFLVLLILFFAYNMQNKQKMIKSPHKIEQKSKPQPIINKDTMNLSTDSVVTFIDSVKINTSTNKKQMLDPDIKYTIDGSIDEYILQKGESLTDISKKYYNSPKFTHYIFLYNKETIKDPNLVHSGMKIKVPRLIPVK